MNPTLFRLPQRIRWMAAVAALLSALPLLATTSDASLPGAKLAPSPAVASNLATLAADSPQRRVEVIVQLDPGVSLKAAKSVVAAAGGSAFAEVPLIHAVGARMTAGEAVTLGKSPDVEAVSLNAATGQRALKPNSLNTSFNHSVQSPEAWTKSGATGKGIGVAVVDTGVDGSLPDFRTGEADAKSRVIATAVTNPRATTARDTVGHGTHVAGIIAGNSDYRKTGDPLDARYAGVAPDANIVAVKVADDAGNATVLDVIYGIQFAVDFQKKYNIRVINLSLESTSAESHRTDPLDAAVEAAWFRDIVVVAAAGNRGTAADSVSYAPGNDPWIISVGAVDDAGTNGVSDDFLASWSSRGVTQDGHQKPELNAPGARIVSNLAPRSAFASLCPTCVVDNEYIRMGGTSMASPMVAGVVANLLAKKPGLTPNDVKALLIDSARTVPGGWLEPRNWNAITGNTNLKVNQGLPTNENVKDTDGDGTLEVDYSASRWSASRWSTASGELTASWSSSDSFVCDCPTSGDTSADPNASRWSASRWSSGWER